MSDVEAPTPTTTTKRSSPTPKLRFQIDDLRSRGTSRFLAHCDVQTLVPICISEVCSVLHGSLKHATTQEVRSVTIVCDEMGGVAYTKGIELDQAHKEIHISMQYIAALPEARVEHEIKGVLYHEMVHVFQHNAGGSCPGGLIEGIADWVRLKCGMAPPHWNQTPGESWDAGYEKTAFFLEFISKRNDDASFVPRLNDAMSRNKWGDGEVFAKVAGASPEHLWKEYLRSSNDGDDEDATAEKPALPTGTAPTPAPALAPTSQSDDR